MGPIKRPFLVLMLSLLFLFIIGSTFLGFYTDWLWFRSLGYTSIFLRLINYKFLLGIIFGGFSALLFYLNGRLVFHLAHTPYPSNTESLPINLPVWLERTSTVSADPRSYFSRYFYGSVGRRSMGILATLSCGLAYRAIQILFSIRIFLFIFFGFLFYNISAAGSAGCGFFPSYRP